MKFAKILQAESVPEWRKKYIDYKTLKALLRHVEKTNVKEYGEIMSQVESVETPSTVHSKAFTMLSDNIPGMKPLVQKISAKFMNLSRGESYLSPVHYRDHLHRNISHENFLDHLNDDERTFFLKLDEELRDISTFYKDREDEMVKNLRLLKLQYEEMRQLKKKKKRRGLSPLSEYEYSPSKEIDYKSARKNIKKAIFEFYRSAELLKNYRTLNKLGFVKILKKFDRVARLNGSYIYMQKVDASNFVTSKVLDQVIKETENFYVDKFEGGMRKQAMMKLRLPNKERQTYYFTVWRVGMYLGISLCLCAYSIPNLFLSDNISRALLTLFVGSLLPIILTLVMGLNMHRWSKSGINYKFIFELDPRNNLDHRQFFELPSIALFFLSCALFLITTSWISRTLYPAIFVTLFLSVFLCPFPIFYYEARRWSIISTFRVFCSYFFRVEFRDFFIADVFNSLSYSFGVIGVFLCSEIRDWPEDDLCYSGKQMWVPFLTSLPPIWRILQVLRRYRATGQANPHLVNMGKYLSTIIASALLFESRKAHSANQVLFSTWVVFQTINSIYTSIWDVVVDWSLLQVDSENPFLRDNLGYKNKKLYYFAIISNVALRFSWVMLAALRNEDIKSGSGQYSSTWLNRASFAIAFLEMLRRCQWAFFRVENEHINNCDQFRAVKELTLPFPKEKLDNVVVSDPSMSSFQKNVIENGKPIPVRQDSLRSFIHNMLPRRRASSLASKDFEPRLEHNGVGMADYSDEEQFEDEDEFSAEESSERNSTPHDDDDDDSSAPGDKRNRERTHRSNENLRNSMFKATSLPMKHSNDDNSIYKSRNLSLPDRPNNSPLSGPSMRRRILGERAEEETNTQSDDITSLGESQEGDNLE